MGADAVLQVAPWYNKPTQEGLYAHFRAIAEVWNIGAHNPGHPWSVVDRIFAGEPRVELVNPSPTSDAEMYVLLRTIAEPQRG